MILTSATCEDLPKTDYRRLSRSKDIFASFAVSASTRIACAAACARCSTCNAFHFTMDQRACHVIEDIKNNPSNSYPESGRVTIYVNIHASDTEKCGTRVLFMTGISGVGKVTRGQISVAAGKSSPYEFLSLVKRPLYVQGAVHLAQNNSIFLCIASSYYGSIIAHVVDRAESYVIVRRVKCHGLAVDEDRGLLFAATYKPMKGIVRIDLNNKSKMKTIYYITRSPYWSIAVNPTSQTIFVATRNSGIQVNYTGGSPYKILRTRPNLVLASDPENNVLYYTDGKTLTSMSLRTYKKKQVCKLADKAFSMIYRDGALYVGFVNEQYVYVHNTKTGYSSKITALTDKRYRTELIICFLQ